MKQFESLQQNSPTASTEITFEPALDASKQVSESVSEPISPNDRSSDELANDSIAVNSDKIAEGFSDFASDTFASKAIISRYFDLLNAGDFHATAALFAEEGVLDPPFDSPAVGREAIVQYLEAEANGLQLFPTRYRREPKQDGTEEYQVGGKVQTSLFGVNVGWKFVLNSAAEILLVKVKLLASLEELLKLKA